MFFVSAALGWWIKKWLHKKAGDNLQIISSNTPQYKLPTLLFIDMRLSNSLYYTRLKAMFMEIFRARFLSKRLGKLKTVKKKFTSR